MEKEISKEVKFVEDLVLLAGISIKKDLNKKNIEILNERLDLKILLSDDNMLSPVLLSMADVYTEMLFGEQSIKTLFPIKYVKSKESLCFITIKENKDFDFISNGVATVQNTLIMMDVIKKVLRENLENKIELTNLVNTWRTTLEQYNEGEEIDIRNHREELIDGNLQMFPSIRKDLQNEKKEYLKNSMNK